MGRYIDPKTDFGFKRLFGQEDSKKILKQFLFDVLALAHPIEELTYIPSEQLPPSPEDRTGVYDVYCRDITGQRFIVEMQHAWQMYIKDHALYYSTFPITHQAKKGSDWQFELLPVYCIIIMNFALDDEDEQYVHRVKLVDLKAKTVFYEKLTYVYIELPKFQPPADKFEQEIDKWIYLLKYMPELQDIPADLKDESFTQAFEIAEEAALSPQERLQYEASLKLARDTYATIEGAHSKGLIEGREEGRRVRSAEIARSMLARDLDRAFIAEVTGLSIEEITGLS